VNPVPEHLKQALEGRYEIQGELGQGGMATVYLARDLKHGREVALKVLSPDLAASIGAERFVQEIQVAARLQHPHIVPLYDSGEAAGSLYYVMPRVEGESLRARLDRERQLPVDEALRIAREVAAALDYAHRQNVVHRDIKPENILLQEGEPLVADFGIARAIDVAGGAQMTRTGLALGTPQYMSTEQASGDREVDGRSDVYSLGCVLYEMLVGEPPFTGPTPQAVMARHFTEPVRGIRTVRAAVPEAVERAIVQALAKVPADRFATAALFAEALSESRLAAPAAHSAAEVSIAVLPFADMSAERDQEYFCDGIAEELINELTKIERLRVAARTSAFAFKGKSQDIRQIGEQLGVGMVLEGSVRKAGDRLRVTAQLIKAADGYHLWSDRYDRQMEDIFAIQDDIAENIAKALRVRLVEDARPSGAPEPVADVRAYDFFLRGRHYTYQWRRKSFEYALQMFDRALEIDPRYARAYAGIADCCSYLHMYWGNEPGHLQRAEEASRKAVELDADSADAHEARGLALSLLRRYPEAEREMEQAIRLNPALYDAYWNYARICHVQGKLEKAAELFERATRVRPEDYNPWSLLTQTYVALGRHQEAEEARRRGLALIERHVALHPEDGRALYLGAGQLGQAGQRERGVEWARRALAMDPDDPSTLYNVACAFSVLGLTDEALACLERGAVRGMRQRAWLEHDSDMDPLRGDPRFKAILERMDQGN
jgi:TolB-like protein